jgi:tetratricopeptide (TPR) repeat protein
MRPLPFILALPISVAFASNADVTRALADANALFAANHRTEAQAAFEKVLELAPENGDANFRLGMYAIDRGDWEAALKYEEKAIDANPNHAGYQFGWGAANGIAAMKANVFSKLGYAHKCQAAYERAVALEPTAPQYRFALLQFHLQAPGFAGGDRKVAYEQAAEIKKLNSDLGRQAYIQVYLAEKKYDLAFSEFDGVLTRTPPDYPALYSYGRLTLMTKQHLEEGLSAFRRCLEIPAEDKFHPAPADVHWRVGSVLEQMGKLADARAEYTAALKEDPQYKPAQKALAKLPTS